MPINKTRLGAPKWRPANPLVNNPVKAAQDAVCERIGTNIYGRAQEFIRMAEGGRDDIARRELLDLLRFFPKRSDPA